MKPSAAATPGAAAARLAAAQPAAAAEVLASIFDVRRLVALVTGGASASAWRSPRCSPSAAPAW